MLKFYILLISTIVSCTRVSFTVFISHDGSHSLHHRNGSEILGWYEFKPLKWYSKWMFHKWPKLPSQTKLPPKGRPIHEKNAENCPTFHCLAFSSSMMLAISGSTVSSEAFNCLGHCRQRWNHQKPNANESWGGREREMHIPWRAICLSRRWLHSAGKTAKYRSPLKRGRNVG